MIKRGNASSLFLVLVLVFGLNTVFKRNLYLRSHHQERLSTGSTGPGNFILAYRAGIHSLISWNYRECV